MVEKKSSQPAQPEGELSPFFPSKAEVLGVVFCGFLMFLVFALGVYDLFIFFQVFEVSCSDCFVGFAFFFGGFWV